MAEQTMVRLVVCQDCKTIEEIPDFNGPVEHDYLLETLTTRHETNGHRHIGAMAKVPEAEWNDPRYRQKIIDQVKQRSGAGLGTEFYAVKQTFQEDAQKCWKAHNRTKNCADFKADSKRIQPNTKAERKELGLAPAQSNRYICEFCPYFMVAVQRMRSARGDYDYTG